MWNEKKLGSSDFNVRDKCHLYGTDSYELSSEMFEAFADRPLSANASNLF
jgi:hypothetical protein